MNSRVQQRGFDSTVIAMVDPRVTLKKGSPPRPFGLIGQE